MFVVGLEMSLISMKHLSQASKTRIQCGDEVLKHGFSMCCFLLWKIETRFCMVTGIVPVTKPHQLWLLLNRIRGFPLGAGSEHLYSPVLNTTFWEITSVEAR